MEFEFDPSKSNLNQNKHGISFVEAQQIWFDFNRVKIPARTEDELRFIVIGKIKEKYWSAVITYRDTKIRIISVRRSRKEEISLYESRRI
ncbi:MAG: BrnT family toxin [Cyanobacteria bacterium]|jgi:uncharacterized DUF497 family protein|nr:BrnT family toxin [Cyanobacteria bacterium GSL.Bin1]